MAITKLSYDLLLEKAGSLGSWQTILFCLLTMISMKQAFNFYVLTFQTLPSKFSCNGNVNLTESFFNATRKLYENSKTWECYSYEYTTGSSFNRAVNNTDYDVVRRPCTSWTYTNEDGTPSQGLVAEWNLVCGREKYIPHIFSAFAVGMILAMVQGFLADRFGRRKIILIMVTSELVLTLAELVVTGPIMYMLVHAAKGFAHSSGLVGLIYLSEVVGPRHRAFVTNGFWLAWCVGSMVVPAFDYIIRDWRWLQVATAFPSLVAIPFIFILYESPRWLVSRGDYKGANEVIARIAKFNGRSIENLPKLEEDYDKDNTNILVSYSTAAVDAMPDECLRGGRLLNEGRKLVG